MFKDILKPTIILILICVFVTAALAGTKIITQDKIDAQERLASEEAQKEALPGFATVTEETANIDGEDVVYNIAKDSSGDIIGYIFVTEYKGYGGAVSVMTGIDTNGTITGSVILSENETPGLGKRAYEESFIGQFADKNVESFTLVKVPSDKDDEITAITGATITSRAVTTAVNEALSLFAEITGGGK
ncbi:MAG: RnfABCDGE type electron transport complex subunit G [Eubacteriales bacterium]